MVTSDKWTTRVEKSIWWWFHNGAKPVNQVKINNILFVTRSHNIPIFTSVFICACIQTTVLLCFFWHLFALFFCELLMLVFLYYLSHFWENQRTGTKNTTTTCALGLTWDTVQFVFMLTFARSHWFPWLPDFCHKGDVSSPVIVFLKMTLSVPTVLNPHNPLMW